MNILLTSDLGLDSSGFLALANGLQRLGQITIWLPQMDWSRREVSSSATKSIRVDSAKLANGMTAWYCTGTPSQTIALAIATHSSTKIDLIVSGVNVTPHTLPTVDHALSYSAGVLAASEGLVWNIPGIAVSLDNSEAEGADFETAVSITQQIVQEQQQAGLPTQLTNITVPAKPPATWTRNERPLTTYYQHLRERREQRLMTPNRPPPISHAQITTLSLPPPLAKILHLDKSSLASRCPQPNSIPKDFLVSLATVL